MIYQATKGQLASGCLPEAGLPDHGTKLKLWSVSNWIQTLWDTSALLFGLHPTGMGRAKTRLDSRFGGNVLTGASDEHVGACGGGVDDDMV